MGAAGDDFKVDGSIIRVPSRESIALHRLNVTGPPHRNSLESRHRACRRGRGLRGSRLISVCSPPPGEVAEWSKAAVLKTVGPKGPGGSNPSLSAKLIPRAERRRRHFSGTELTTTRIPVMCFQRLPTAARPVASSTCVNLGRATITPIVVSPLTKYTLPASTLIMIESCAITSDQNWCCPGSR